MRSDSALGAYFGDCYDEFEHVLIGSSAISQNGDDAIELFEQGVVIETLEMLIPMEQERHGSTWIPGHIS